MRPSTCTVIGGGPAGMVLALLLARAGVEVTVFEKHNDFLRDFRGDTVHPTTLRLLDELGLGERFAELPQRRVDQIAVPVGPDGDRLVLGDIRRLPHKYNYIAMVPQWDLLDLLARAGSTEPTFSLRMNTEVTELISEGGVVRGVRYRTSEGETGEHRSTITIACDGRDSLVRDLAQLRPMDFPTPMDVRWFQIPRQPTDPAGGLGVISERSFVVCIDRGDFFQVGYLVRKGTDAEDRRHSVELLNERLVRALPWLAGRDLVARWEDVKLLHVKLDRLRKWHLPGLLCIGDAAHAMSPVGGIGINLAVQDAVAAARYLAAPLREGRLRRRHVAAVQRRRWPTTALIQRGQRAVHTNVIEPALRGEFDFGVRTKPPWVLNVLPRVPGLRVLPAYLLAYGALRERPPRSALRTSPRSEASGADSPEAATARDW